mgnify:CR=1 FL=1
MKSLSHIIVIGCCALSLGSALAAPVGFSVNSDAADGDELYAIDLANGIATVRGPVTSGVQDFLDVEGLALAPDGTLWGVDDERLSLFPISPANGTVDFNAVEPILGINAVAGNDFGMTFTCAGDLFISSVADGALYRLALDGTATLVGALPENISALASFGNPARLFGLSNGQDEGGNPDSRSLFEIDPTTAALTLVGPIGAAPSAYAQAGLSFDADGNLWALTDRRIQGQDLGSEVLRLDLATGVATVVATTAQTGFESLAVSPPAGCQDTSPGPPQPSPPDQRPAPIPTLDAAGRLGAALALLLTGLFVLRRHF